MGLEIGGYSQEPDWPKMGPSLLIAACLILAVRTAKWPVRHAQTTASDRDLEVEIGHAIHLAGLVLSTLVSQKPGLFKEKKVPWFVPDGEDSPE